MAQVLKEKPQNAPAETSEMKQDSVFLREITLTNLLSFGPDTPPLTLGPLNVLIGANGSGKSNLIEAISLLRAASKDFQKVTSQGGGVEEWIWKGQPNAQAGLQAFLTYPQNSHSLKHSLRFEAQNQAFRLVSEVIENHSPGDEETGGRVYSLNEKSELAVGTGSDLSLINATSQNGNAPILTRLRDPERFAELTYLAEQYDRIRIYRDWQFGRNSVLRNPQRADLRTDALEEDFSNLALFLSRLRRYPEAKHKILKYLRDLYDGLDDFDLRIEGGSVQIFFTEGDFTIPASRLSDGALRYLALLAILCDPTPPPLICLDEPELGIHNDLMPTIVDIMVEASKRTQLIVTTHSTMLIDCLTPMPEVILVVEREAKPTSIDRLDPNEVCIWFDKYGLGELWVSGELGGKRW